MLTLEKVNQEIAGLIANTRPVRATADPMTGRKIPSEELAEANKARTRLNFLKEIKLYLETKPRREYIEKEIFRIGDLISKIDLAYIELDPKIGLSMGQIAQHRKDYEKEHDLTNLRSQVKVLRYIIDGDYSFTSNKDKSYVEPIQEKTSGDAGAPDRPF